MLALYSACDDPEDSVAAALDGGSQMDSGHARDGGQVQDGGHAPVDGSTMDAGDAGGTNDAGDAGCTMPVPDPPSIEDFCANGGCPDWESALSMASEDDGGGLVDYTVRSGCGVDSVDRNVGSVHGHSWYFDHDTHELIGYLFWGDVMRGPCEALMAAGRRRGDCPTVRECDWMSAQLCIAEDPDGGT